MLRGVTAAGGAVLTQRHCLAVRARINSTDGRSAGAHIRSGGQQGLRGPGQVYARHAAGRSIFQRGSCPLPPATSVAIVRGRQRAGRRGQAARALSAPAPVAGGSGTGHGPAWAREDDGARAASCPCLATHRQRIHSFGAAAAARARGPGLPSASARRAARLASNQCGFNSSLDHSICARWHWQRLAASGRAQAQCRSVARATSTCGG